MSGPGSEARIVNLGTWSRTDAEPEQVGAAIACRDLRKSFGDRVAVDGLDLEVPSGQITALLGPSGCGKTTTLRLIAGLESPDAGSVEIDGRLVSGDGEFLPAERRGLGFVFQDYALFPHLDVRGNVAYALGESAPAGRLDELLAIVGLEDVASRHPGELSGGQQQRVALARALAGSPSAILLDEPFSNLDASLRDRMRREVREILTAACVTSIFVTHDQEEALSIADTVAVMRDGRIEQTGSPEDVYSRPASRWVAEFLGEADVLAAHAHSDRVECALGSVPIAAGFEGDAELIIRPESIAIADASEEGPRHGVGSQDAVVVSKDYFGHDQLLGLQLGSGLRVRTRRPGFPTWQPGDRVRVWVDGPVTVLPAHPRG